MRWVFPIWLAARVFACQAIDGDRILGKDVAAADAAFAALGPDLEMGAAPLAGVRRVVQTEELARWARQHGVAISTTLSPICFERVTEKLTVERLLAALQQAHAMEAAEIEILDYSRYSVPRGTLEFTRAGLSETGLWRGRVVYSETRSSPVWVKVRVTRREVERGDKVAVEVSSGGAMLAFEATAESSGRAGDSVVVRNPENGRLFQAKVDGKGKVSVKK
jgi:flagella basal body P-ring formation protein FlgA